MRGKSPAAVACGDVGAEAGRPSSVVSPQLHDLGDDAGVPRAAGRGDRAGDVVGKDRRQDHLAPPLPAAQAEIAGRIAAGRSGTPLAPAITLNRMYHCVPRIISGLSQISGLSSKRTISDDRDGKEQVGRERREKLHDRLRRSATPRAQPDPDADRHPDQRGERDQHHHAQQR